MTTKADAQDEKRRVLANDLSLRSGSTLLDHVEPSPGGRFAALGAQTIVGQSPNPYPPLPDTSPWHGADPVGPEPALGYRIDDLEPFGGGSISAGAGQASVDVPSAVIPSADAPRVDAGPSSQEEGHDAA